jgi:predicted dehydrogenase
MAVTPVGVAVVGCGLIGRRRAAAAAADERTRLGVVVDIDEARAAALGTRLGADHGPDWRAALERDDIGALVVCTPNALLVPIAAAALQAGRSVLIEKPMGRSLGEARQLAAVAAAAPGVLKIGFNHRYHPAVARARELFEADEIGGLVNMRARYGHGSRPGCEREWRGDPRVAGGGELLDQGVHVLDLFHWFAGPPIRVQAELQTAVWPLGPLEDNAFALLRFAGGVVGQLHVSMTQWRNLFSLEIHGSRGALLAEGLGGSYGPERLTVIRRALQGGVPDVESVTFDGPDTSWQEEWSDFAAALHGRGLRHGTVADGLLAMATLEAAYAAAAAGAAVEPEGTGSAAGTAAAVVPVGGR